MSMSQYMFMNMCGAINGITILEHWYIEKLCWVLEL